jgi:serine/threonine-protein kinase
MTTYLKPGDTIAGRYQVIRPISQGGMGAVYLAEQTSLGREVAIKVILDGVKDNEMLRRFDLEAKAVCLLKHPNIITYHDYGRDDAGNPYIVMEYLHGYPATQLFDPTRGVTLEVLCHVIAQMCSALGEAHRKNVIHRDLKWSNIMICPQGHDEYFAKLIDFGIVKIPADNAMKQGLTQTGMLLGTPQYMPPEAIQGRKVDGRADQYSLAIMLWEGIEGRKPFEADSMFEVFRMHVQDPPPGFERGKKLLSIYPGLEEAILRAMSKNPEDRFPTILEFQRAIFESLGLAVGPSALELARSTLPNGGYGTTPSGRMRGASGLQPVDTRLRTSTQKAKKGMPAWAMAAIGIGVALAATAGILVATQGGKTEDVVAAAEAPVEDRAEAGKAKDPADKATESGTGTEAVADTAKAPVKVETPPEQPKVAEASATNEVRNPPVGDSGQAGANTQPNGAGVNTTTPPNTTTTTTPNNATPDNTVGTANNTAPVPNTPPPNTTTTPPADPVARPAEVVKTPPKPAEPALPKMRQLIVTVRPWGNVTINGQDYGQSPVSAEFATNKGYTIVATNPSLGRKQQTIKLNGDRDGKPMRVTLDFES